MYIAAYRAGAAAEPARQFAGVEVQLLHSVFKEPRGAFVISHKAVLLLVGYLSATASNGIEHASRTVLARGKAGV